MYKFIPIHIIIITCTYIRYIHCDVEFARVFLISTPTQPLRRWRTQNISMRAEFRRPKWIMVFNIFFNSLINYLIIFITGTQNLKRLQKNIHISNLKYFMKTYDYTYVQIKLNICTWSKLVGGPSTTDGKTMSSWSWDNNYTVQPNIFLLPSPPPPLRHMSGIFTGHKLI